VTADVSITKPSTTEETASSACCRKSLRKLRGVANTGVLTKELPIWLFSNGQSNLRWFIAAPSRTYSKCFPSIPANNISLKVLSVFTSSSNFSASVLYFEETLITFIEL
jgi:hypothetical protein